jgi:hypothetical protein
MAINRGGKMLELAKVDERKEIAKDMITTTYFLLRGIGE